MEIEVPAELKNSNNKNVLEFLKPLSCHSDIIGPIYKILKKEREARFFCPDPENFKYCFWYVERSIFAYASGMQHIALLLPSESHSEAIFSGAIQSKDLSENWFLFPYNHIGLTKWAGLAFASAKSS